MATDTIYRDSKGKLRIGKSNVESQVVGAVYRATASTKFVVEGGNFVETDRDGRGSRILCPTDR